MWLEKINNGEELPSDEQRKVLKRARQAAKRIERKYGRKNLGWDDFEWGLLSGRMSALAWVMGPNGMTLWIHEKGVMSSLSDI